MKFQGSEFSVFERSLRISKNFSIFPPYFRIFLWPKKIYIYQKNTGFGIFRICTEPPYFQEFFRISVFSVFPLGPKNPYIYQKIFKKKKSNFFFLGRDLEEKKNLFVFCLIFFFVVVLQMIYEDDFIRINKE